jgi:molybdopterin/thiamine biosynthesis adenylyltransferase
MQATEALKLVLGIGEPLIGRLMLYDALEQTTSQLRVNRDPNCAACGDEGHPPTLVDYDDTCRPA